MTNEEGFLGIVIIMGIIFLVIVPGFIGLCSVLLHFLLGRVKSRGHKVAIVAITTLALLLLTMITPFSRYGMVGPPCIALIALIALSQQTSAMLYEKKFRPIVISLIIFVSAFVCGTLTMLAYVSVISIPQYFDRLANLQFVLYYAGGVIFSTMVFSLASLIKNRLMK